MTVVGPGELKAKLVIAGAPGSGRGELLHAFARRMGGLPVRAEMVGDTQIERVETRWPDPLADGRLLRVVVFATTGPSRYRAIDELLLTAVDGVVFLLDVSPEHLHPGWEALAALAENLKRTGTGITTLPLVVQYHRTDHHDGFSAEQVDEWLNLPVERIPRFTSPAEAPDRPGGSIDTLVAEIARRVTPPGG